MTPPAGDLPPEFFARLDEDDDARFYAVPRFVTHIDDAAIAAVGELYEELGIDGDVLDLMSSWVSHFRVRPAHLTVLGMNERSSGEPGGGRAIVHDLNADPRIPLPDACVDDVVCCVSVDYLTQPVDVFRDVARVLRPAGRFVCTFSNRVFATKAVRGWLTGSDADRCAIVAGYFEASGAFEPATVSRRTPPGHRGDPLFAVWASVQDPGISTGSGSEQIGGGPTDQDVVGPGIDLPPGRAPLGAVAGPEHRERPGRASASRPGPGSQNAKDRSSSTSSTVWVSPGSSRTLANAFSSLGGRTSRGRLRAVRRSTARPSLPARVPVFVTGTETTSDVARRERAAPRPWARRARTSCSRARGRTRSAARSRGARSRGSP